MFHRKKQNNESPDITSKIQEFSKLYYHGTSTLAAPWTKTTWLGVQTLKCPLDLWIYQEILIRTRPEVIIETGLWAGGSSLYLATIFDLMGQGKVIACDITLERVEQKVHDHPRITLLEGSSTDPQIFSEIKSLVQDRATMVVLDSDHSYNHVLQELGLYSTLVSNGCYLICEDTNVNGHPVLADHGPGPFEAVAEFLRNSPEWSMDVDCERHLLTFNPSGYLRRK